MCAAVGGWREGGRGSVIKKSTHVPRHIPSPAPRETTSRAMPQTLLLTYRSLKKHFYIFFVDMKSQYSQTLLRGRGEDLPSATFLISDLWQVALCCSVTFFILCFSWKVVEAADLPRRTLFTINYSYIVSRSTRKYKNRMFKKPKQL